MLAMRVPRPHHALPDLHRRPLRRRPVAPLATGLALAALLTACGAPRGGDPLPFVPADADNVLIVPSLAALQDSSSHFLAGIEGTSGLLTLVADRFGLDLRTPDGLESLGLDPTRGLGLYTLTVPPPSSSPTDTAPPPSPDTPTAASSAPAIALVATLPVARPDRFLEVAGLRLERSAGLTPKSPGANPTRYTSTPPSIEVALGTVETPDGPVGLLVVAQSPADPLALWQAAARPAAPFVGSPRDTRASAPATGPGATTPTLRFAWRFDPPPAPATFGLLRSILDNLLARLSTWEGTATVTGDQLAIAMTTAPSTAPEPTPLPVVWVNFPKPRPNPLAAAFPRTTTAFFRLRVNLDKLRSVPSFVRNNLIPDRLPGLESLPLPSNADLIDLLEGDLAIAVLGLDPAARLADLTSRNLPNRLLSIFRVALAAKLRDPAAARRAFAGIAEQLSTSGWAVAPIAHLSTPAPTNPWAGWTFARDGQHYSVLIDDQVAVFLLGEGELDAFLAVREGRALSLASFADAPSPTPPQPGAPVPNPAASPTSATPTTSTAGRALGLAPDSGFVGLVLSPLRLTRELAARSIPPYFLKVINDLRLLSGDLSATDAGVTLRLELGL